MITLLVRPHDGHGLFDVYEGEALLLTTRQPLFDGARALLARGADPGELMTTRAAGSAVDNFGHRAIAVFAGLSAEEERFRIVRYRPRPVAR